MEQCLVMSVRYGQGMFVCNPVLLLAAPSHLDVSRYIAGVNSGRLIFEQKYLNSNFVIQGFLFDILLGSLFG